MNQVPNYRTVAQQQRRDQERIESKRTLRTQLRERHNLGRMDNECIHCGVLHWLDERSSPSRPKFGMCCSHGKVVLPLLQNPPLLLCQLFEDQDEHADSTFDNTMQCMHLLLLV